MTHLIVVDFMLQVMCGSLLQFVAVVAGANIWRPRLVATLVHPLITAGAVFLATAFLLTYLFYGRNLKPVARRHLTRLALAARLLEGFALSGASLWPEVQRSD